MDETQLERWRAAIGANADHYLKRFKRIAAMDIPPGFAPLFRASPVLDLIGPLYSRGKGADLVIGLRVEAKHCYLCVGEERIARASAAFLITDKR